MQWDADSPCFQVPNATPAFYDAALPLSNFLRNRAASRHAAGERDDGAASVPLALPSVGFRTAMTFQTNIDGRNRIRGSRLSDLARSPGRRCASCRCLPCGGGGGRGGGGRWAAAV
jgi:hypothetical protein